MALGLSSNGNGEGGSFLPIVKWDARAGRFFRVDREQGPNGWASNDVDLTMDRPKFAVDFGSIETGFLHFGPTGPDFHMVPMGSQMPKKPSADHKLGFRVKVAGNVLKGVREFSSSAKAVLAAMDTLHDAFMAAPESASGKIPVVELAGSTTVVTNGPQGKVTAYGPVFKIVAWTDRLPELGDRTVAAPNGTEGAAVTAGPASNHVPPPAPKPAPVQAATEQVPDAMPF